MLASCTFAALFLYAGVASACAAQGVVVCVGTFDCAENGYACSSADFDGSVCVCLEMLKVAGVLTKSVGATTSLHGPEGYAILRRQEMARITDGV